MLTRAWRKWVPNLYSRHLGSSLGSAINMVTEQIVDTVCTSASSSAHWGNQAIQSLCPWKISFEKHTVDYVPLISFVQKKQQTPNGVTAASPPRLNTYTNCSFSLSFLGAPFNLLDGTLPNSWIVQWNQLDL